VQPHKKEKMKTLKEMIFRLMSQTLSLKEFETWLYADNYIKSQLLEDETIFELVSIDLRSKHAFHELQKFCFNHFDKEECLVQVVKYNSELLLETKTDAAAEKFMKSLYYFQDWNDDYSLITQIYYLTEDWEFVDYGYVDKQQLRNELFGIAETFVKQLEGLSVKESIQLFRKGVEYQKAIPEEPAIKRIENENKKLFQFWK
jgi:hypothetical protein